MMIYVFIGCLAILLALRFLYLSQNQANCKVAATNFSTKNNEPLIIQKEKECLIIVTDPIGALRIGSVACLIAQEVIAKHYEESRKSRTRIPPAEFLKKACFLAHRAISEQMNANSGGCSIALVYINRKNLSYASVGDIGIYGCHDELEQLNQLDLYKYQLSEQVLKRKIRTEHLLNNRLRNELTAYLGYENLKRVHLNTNPIPLVKGDKLFIATKAVYEVMTPLTIEAIILESDKPATSMKQLEGTYHVQKQANEPEERVASAVLASHFK